MKMTDQHSMNDDDVTFPEIDDDVDLIDPDAPEPVIPEQDPTMTAEGAPDVPEHGINPENYDEDDER